MTDNGLNSVIKNSEKCINIKSDNENKKSVTVYKLVLDYSKERFFGVDKSELSISNGDYVVVSSKYGNDMSRVAGIIESVEVPNDAIEIIREANENDLKRYYDNKKREKNACKVFREKVELHKLEMKLLKTHFLLDESKVLFFFSAENRIDFRKLVKDLVSVFRMRVELRQIGVRDESRITGGLGPCGRVFCCHEITDNLQPVSIKMAKEQNLSLNSLKISGQCGRLLCCLAYEHEWYSDVKKKLPTVGDMILYCDSPCKIIDVNVVRGIISIMGEDSGITKIDTDLIYKEDGRWIAKTKPRESEETIPYV